METSLTSEEWHWNLNWKLINEEGMTHYDDNAFQSSLTI